MILSFSKKNECPPYLYLYQLAEHCPRAIASYMQLWRDKDESNRLTIYKKDIPTVFLKSPLKLRNDLMLLVKEGLASIDENPLTLTIELVGYDPNFNEEGD